MTQLSQETQEAVQEVVDEVLQEVKETKYYNADILHHLRSKITEKVKEKIGPDSISTIDVILDLNELEDVKFAFKVSVPKNDGE